MIIQFNLPAEYVVQAKTIISQINPLMVSPTDADVLQYVGSSLLTGLVGLFPMTMLQSQIPILARIAQDQALVQAATVTALDVKIGA